MRRASDPDLKTTKEIKKGTSYGIEEDVPFLCICVVNFYIVQYFLCLSEQWNAMTITERP